MSRTETVETVRLLAFLSISALLSLSVWMLLLLPVYLEDAGWSSQSIGWAMGLYFLVNLVFYIVAGQLVNQWGNVPTGLFGAAAAGLGAVFYLGALWFPVLVFPARALHGMGSALITSGALLQLTQSVPPPLRGRMIGYFGLPGFVMLGVGPVVSEWVVLLWGFQGTFLLVLLCFLLIGWILSTLPRPLAPRGASQLFLKTLRAVLPDLKGILIFSVIFGFSFSCWNAFLAPAVGDLGAGAVSSFGIGYGLGAILTRLGISNLLERGEHRLIGIATLLVYGVGLILIPQVQQNWHLAGLAFLLGMCHGVYYPSLSSLATERFHPLHTGQAMSLYISASSLGMFLGPPFWGKWVDRMGYPQAFAAAGLVLFLSTALFMILVRRDLKQEKQNDEVSADREEPERLPPAGL